jgi:hypothetical protein
MADKKISELTNITGSTIADTDEFVVVDASASETKAITAAELRTAIGNGDFTVTGNLTVQGTTITVDSAAAQNIVLGDNDKMTFGAGSDLQIYHDGSNSHIKDTATGNLNISGNDIQILNAASNEAMAYFAQDGGVTLYHNGSSKLATTATGVDVTGTITSDGLETLHTSGDVGYRLGYNSGSSAYIHRDSATGNYLLQSDETGSSWKIETDNGSGPLTRLEVDRYGDISFYEDTGTTPKFFWDASAESLGIGTSSIDSNAKLVVSNNGAEGLEIRANSTNIELFAYNRSAATYEPIVYNGLSHEWRNSNGNVATIDSSGNVGIGTSSPENFAGFTTQTINGSTGSVLAMQAGGVSGTARFVKTASVFSMESISAVPIVFFTNNSEAMRIDSGGNVGIGTSSPAHELHVYGSTTVARLEGNSSGVYLNFKDTGGDSVFIGAVGDSAYFETNGAERMRIDSSGNVIVKAGKELRLNRPDDATYGAISHGASGTGLVYNDVNGDGHHWQFAGSEKMRIDSSGNLLVGKTSDSFGTAGAAYRANGSIAATASANEVLDLNRLSTDGNIMRFFQDGAPMGSIASEGGNSLIIQGGTTGGAGLHLHGNSFTIAPARNNARIDATIDLGRSATRFKDLYLSGGVIGTAGARIYSSETSGSGLILSAGVIYPSGNTGATANGQVDLGSAGVKFKDLYLSGGVYLGGTGAANKLDDYEEGLHTPIIYGSTTGTGTPLPIRSTYDRLAYTKIGRLVTIQGKLETLGSHSATGDLRITLPFAAADLDDLAGVGCGSVLFYRTGQLHTNPTPVVSEGVTYLSFYENTGTGDLQSILAQNMDSAIEFFVSITYMTS